MKNNLFEQIKAASSSLPKKQASICAYICEHPVEVSAMTAAEFAKNLGVGTATITRLISGLGFSNYSDFKRELKKGAIIEARNSYADYWNRRWDMIADDEHTLYQKYFIQLQENISEINSPNFYEKLDRGANMIISARKIAVIGLRSSRPLALQFNYMLRNTMDNIIPLCEEPEYVYDDISRLNSEDLVIICATYPYVKKCGDVARLCHRNKIPTILISSGEEAKNPLAKIMDLVLSAGASEDAPTFQPSMIIVDLLTKRVGAYLSNKTSQILKDLDQTLIENGLTIWEQTIG